MRYFSLFSGAGGFELGIKYVYSEQAKRFQQGVSDGTLSGSGKPLMESKPLCIGFSEVDKYASAILSYQFPETKNYGDITKIDWNAVPDFDLLVGGSPCQDFSIAGKRAGIEGARSGLFGEYIRALENKKPAYFIWENVKGVLSSGGGRDFGVILDSMAEAGYSLWWQVLNAKDFGVPQNRERVFVVGTRNGSGREVFFERESGGNNQDGSVIAGTVTSRYPASQREGAYIEETRHSPTKIGTFRTHEDGRGFREVKSGLAPTLPARARQDGSGQAVIETKSRIRRLIPKETERLMGWPDDWTKYGRKEDGSIFEISDTQRYKICGNGVVANVVTELFKAHLL